MQIIYGDRALTTNAFFLRGDSELHGLLFFSCIARTLILYGVICLDHTLGAIKSHSF